MHVLHRKQIILAHLSILHFYTFLTVVVFRYWCRVSGLVPFGYLCRLQCCYSYCYTAFYCLTIRSTNKYETLQRRLQYWAAALNSNNIL